MYNRREKTAETIKKIVGNDIDTMLKLMEQQEKINLYFFVWLILLTSIVAVLAYNLIKH
jgi:hypothetical protein